MIFEQRDLAGRAAYEADGGGHVSRRGGPRVRHHRWHRDHASETKFSGHAVNCVGIIAWAGRSQSA